MQITKARSAQDERADPGALLEMVNKMIRRSTSAGRSVSTPLQTARATMYKKRYTPFELWAVCAGSSGPRHRLMPM